MKKLLLIGLLALVVVLGGCNSVASFLGADVVTDNIKDADSIRHKYTLQYIDATLPLVDQHMAAADKKKFKDIGERLKRISEKENKLLQGTWDE